MNWEILLSHHPPEEGHRCVKVAGVHLCRRCLALYPLTFAVIALQLALKGVPEDLQLWLLALGPLVPTLLFIAEQLDWLEYGPVQVYLGSLWLSIPLGVGLARYLLDPLEPLFWGMVLIYGIPAGMSVLYRKWPRGA